MAYEWQTVEAAAVTLGISTRTLARRIAEGKIESRLENGRREVFVSLPDEEPAEEPAAPHQSLPFYGGRAPAAMPDLALSYDASDVSDTPGPAQSLAAHASPHSPAGGLSHEMALAEDRLLMAEERIRCAELTVTAFRQHADFARTEVRRAKIGAISAWCAVAAMGVGVVAVVGWATARVTRSDAQADYLQQQVQQVSAEHERTVASQDVLRHELEEARVASAKSAGQLDATRQHLAAEQDRADRPSLLARVAGAILDHAARTRDRQTVERQAQADGGR